MDVIFGNQNHAGEFHKTGFTERILWDYVVNAGLEVVSLSRMTTRSQMTKKINFTAIAGYALTIWVDIYAIHENDDRMDPQFMQEYQQY